MTLGFEPRTAEWKAQTNPLSCGAIKFPFLFISVAFLFFIHNFPTFGDILKVLGHFWLVYFVISAAFLFLYIISPHLGTFKSLGSFLVGLFCNCLNFEPTLVNLYAIV